MWARSFGAAGVSAASIDHRRVFVQRLTIEPPRPVRTSPNNRIERLRGVCRNREACGKPGKADPTSVHLAKARTRHAAASLRQMRYRKIASLPQHSRCVVDIEKQMIEYLPPVEKRQVEAFALVQQPRQQQIGIAFEESVGVTVPRGGDSLNANIVKVALLEVNRADAPSFRRNALKKIERRVACRKTYFDRARYLRRRRKPIKKISLAGGTIRILRS